MDNLVFELDEDIQKKRVMIRKISATTSRVKEATFTTLNPYDEQQTSSKDKNEN